MPDASKPRKRAVRLVPEALDSLQVALVARWQSGSKTGKLTRKARADLLDVSVATANHILANDGVDRATLALAFNSLGLPWEDSFCEHVADPKDAGARPEDVPATPALKPVSRFPRYAPIVGAITGSTVLALAIGAFLRRPNWDDEYNTAYEDGLARYHRADYAGAGAQTRKAIEIARAHNAAGEYANALCLAGDVSGAKGDLAGASRAYRESLHLRTEFAQDRARPAVLEALGDVETRSGHLPEARQALLESLAGYRRYRDPVGVAMATRDLGTVAFTGGDLNGADRWFAQSLRTIKNAGKPEIVADVEGRKALVTLRRGRAGEARAALRKCERFWRDNGHPRWVAVCRLRLGIAEIQLGRRPEAEALFASSRTTFDRVGDRAGAAEAAAWLARRRDPPPENVKFGPD